VPRYGPTAGPDRFGLGQEVGAGAGVEAGLAGRPLREEFLSPTVEAAVEADEEVDRGRGEHLLRLGMRREPDVIS
jgi:hypothetical protein